MSATTTETVLDVAQARDRVAHLACSIDRDRPDEPVHALCGHPLLNVDAPREAPRCGDCGTRLSAGGGGFAAALGLLRCDAHPAGGAA